MLPGTGRTITLAASSAGPMLVFENRSGYDTGDLARLVQRGLGAVGVRRPKKVVVTASPIYTRGCASITGDVPWAPLSIAVAAPSRFTLAKLARIVEHEGRHLLGRDHDDMPARQLYTSSPLVPAWARGMVVRYRGRAPDQLGRMGPQRAAKKRDQAPGGRRQAGNRIRGRRASTLARGGSRRGR